MTTLTPTQETESKMIEILKYLEETFSSKDTKKIKEAKNKLAQIFKEMKTSIDLLFQILSTKSISGKEISLDLHKSVSLYLKNILLLQKKLEVDVIHDYLIKIFDLIFNKSKDNPHLLNNSIMVALQTMIMTLLSNQKLIESKPDLINQLFDKLLTSLQNASNDDFLIIAKSVILLCSSLFTSKSANADNYEKLLNDYYIKIINIIFSNVTKYLIPKSNIYNNEFIIILKFLLEGFYSCLLRMKLFFPSEKRKEISMKMFKEYGTYCLELIQLTPVFDEQNKKQFGNPNPIIVFNIEDKLCSEMNMMKSKAIQFVSYITQISTLEERNANMILETNNVIPDQELIDLVNKFIVLIVNSFEDILRNENKFNLIRKYNGESNEDEDAYNILLYQICVFLTRCLVREPIKSQFMPNMRKFLLNILFPLLVTTDDENIFLETDPEGYHQYISDVVNDFKIKILRTSGCFLLKKICDKYEDMSNFMLSYCLEMLNFLLNGGQIDEKLQDINIYLKNKDALINQFNDKKKLDFALLIILVLKDKLKISQYLKIKLVDILMNNIDKIHSVPFPIIKIKLCKIYYYFLPRFFVNTKKIQEQDKINFLEKVVNYLLNNIIQKNLQTGEEYSQALSYGASETVIELLNLPKESSHEENSLLNIYVTKNLENNFGILNQLIPNVDIYTFFIVIDHVIGNIKINKRNLVFECINNLTKKFLNLFVSPNDESKLFLNQYFTIISSFLLGENKLIKGNKEEINKFNEYFLPVINYIKNPKKFNLYEHLVSTMEEYIKCLDGINEESSLVLKSIKYIIEKDETLSSVCFSYISTFLNYIQNSVSDKPLNQEELFMDILDIIKKGFSIKEESIKISKINSLLLTLQILSLNPNLNDEIIQYLILQSLDCFELSVTNNDILNTKDNINQLSLANVSLGFIFKPELTFQILQKSIQVENNGEKKEVKIFTKYLFYIREILGISLSGNYSPSLGKCIILGICGILSNKTCMESLKQKIDIKLFLLTVFINMMLFHKRQKTYYLNRLTKKETNCNFVQDNENGEEEEEEDEEEDDYEDNEEFNADIDKVLKRNNNINNSDEFKFFSKVLNNIKETEKDLYEHIKSTINRGKNILEDISLARNVEIKYKNKKIFVPRKTVRIIRKTKK